MKQFLLLITLIPFLTSCSGIAEGVTEAFMKKKEVDTRVCDITGPSFTGVSQSVDAQSQQGAPSHTKVLMVHGIGKHLPDYSASFRDKLIRELNLDKADATVKEINLTAQEGNKSEAAGILKIFRYMSSTSPKELIFYELTWSGITDKDKEVIAYDDSDAYAYRRAGLNKSLKSFMNNTVPDVLVYEGPAQDLINKSIGQSLCWMFKEEWDGLPKDGTHYCGIEDPNFAKNVKQDDYFVVTHSLGSRITIDTLNKFGSADPNCTNCEGRKNLHAILKNKEITVFMLANQLPFLQVGRPKPANAGMTGQYCLPSGSLYEERMLGKTRIVAFSDPNDILSYPIPMGYADNYIDSRTCPEIVNIDINVAQASNVFGLIDYANPLDAHTGYMQDDRVVKIITHGLQRENLDPLIANRCHWTETVKTETSTQAKKGK